MSNSMKRLSGVLVVVTVLVLALGVGVVSAQEGPRQGGPVWQYERALIAALANAAGVTPLDVLAELRAGKSLAEVAAAQNVDAAAVVANAVAALTAQINQDAADGWITQEQADEALATLAEDLTAMMDHPAAGLPVQSDRQSLRRLGEAALLRALTDVTGLQLRDLVEQSRDGATLAEIAQADGVDPQAVVDAALANVTGRVNEMVANGRLTQDQADRLLAEAETFFGEAINRALPAPSRPVQRAARVWTGMALVDATAEAAGLSRREVLAQARAGKTLAQIAGENGADVNAIVSDVAAQVTERVNQAVANGNLTQERADEILSTLEADLLEAMNTVPEALPAPVQPPV